MGSAVVGRNHCSSVDVAGAFGAWVATRLYETHVAGLARLADATRLLAGDPGAPALVPSGSGSARALALAVNQLADQRRTLEAEMARLVDEASRKVALERDQLAALMAEFRV